MSRSARTVAMVSLLLLSACTGIQQSSRSSRPSDGPFTSMPRGDEEPESLFLDADAAFRAGDYVTAQRIFGTLFIVNPAHRAGVAEEAVTATCERLGVDCDLVFGRLEIMREVYYNRWGPIDAWVPAQRTDYMAILRCYESMLLGDPQSASGSGTSVLRSPDAYFAASAQRCVDAADVALVAIERQRQADAALQVWLDHQPCMNENRQLLLDAADSDDWETFVEVEPFYQRCAQPLLDIVDGGLLATDPRLGMDHDLAWSDMSEIDAILEDSAEEIGETREAIEDLQNDSDYQRKRTQYDNLAFEETRLQNQIRSLETARDTLTGANRAGVEAQIDTLQSTLVSVRTRMREVLGDINRMRRHRDLAPRDTP